MKYLLWLLVLLEFSVSQAWAQDIAKLRERCSALWAERIAGDRVKASRFVEEKNRNDFISTYEPTVKSATIVGVDFSDTPNKVSVTVKALLALPIGEVERTVVEPWVWTDRNWFLQLMPTANPFSSTPASDSANSASQALAAAPVDSQAGISFAIVDSKIDLGTRTQGEIVKGSVRFKGVKSTVLSIRGTAPDSLRIAKVNWEDANGGTIDFTLDTTLISGDILGDAVFVALASLTRQKAVNIPISGKVNGRVRFSQTPPVADTTKDGTIEVQIQNIWNVPITITRAVTMHPSMDAVFEVPAAIKPGESAKVTIKHKAQKLPKPASLRVTFANDLFPKTVSLPLKTAVTRNVQSNYSREELEEIISRHKRKKQR